MSVKSALLRFGVDHSVDPIATETAQMGQFSGHFVFG